MAAVRDPAGRRGTGRTERAGQPSRAASRAAGLLALVFLAVPASAQDAPDLDALLSELADPDTRNWQQVERKITLEWSKSGSPAMDLLLQRGRTAIEAEDWDTALEHYTALTDHAPDFAAGWAERASVYFQLGLYGPALDDLRRALALNPHQFNALSGLAVMLEDMGLRAEALEAWRMVSRVHPHRPETRAALERLEQEIGGAPI